MSLTAFLIRCRDAAGDRWWVEAARVRLDAYDPAQERRARRAYRRLTAWDSLLTAWRDARRRR